MEHNLANWQWDKAQFKCELLEKQKRIKAEKMGNEIRRERLRLRRGEIQEGRDIEDRSWAKKNELKEGKEKWKVIGNGGMKTGKGLKAGLKWGKSLGAGHRTLDTNTGTYYVEWAIWAACEGVFRAIAKARVIELQDLTVLELPTVVRTGLSLGPDVMTDRSCILFWWLSPARADSCSFVKAPFIDLTLLNEERTIFIVKDVATF